MMAPYEALGIKIVDLFIEILKGQPMEVKAELWKLHLQDIKAWREFWSKDHLGGGN